MYNVRDLFFDCIFFLSCGFMLGIAISEDLFYLLPIGLMISGFLYYKYVKQNLGEKKE